VRSRIKQPKRNKSDSRELIYGASSELWAFGRERIRWGRGASGRGSQGRRRGAEHVPAAAVAGAAVAGGGADGAGPLQGEREVVELPLRLAAQGCAGGAQVGQSRGDEHPRRQHARCLPRRRHRLPILLCLLRQVSSIQQCAGRRGQMGLYQWWGHGNGQVAASGALRRRIWDHLCFFPFISC